MFLKMRKLRETFGSKSSVPEDDATKEKSEEGATDGGDTLVTQAINLGDIDNNQTKNLAETGEQLGQLVDTPESASEEQDIQDILSQPVQSEEKAADKENDLSILLGGIDEEEGEQADKEKSDSLSNLFSQEEDEENPLSGLINSLPDATAKELIDDAKEVKTMIVELQHG